jgi:ABC-2 type transport system ATP-binding protein
MSTTRTAGPAGLGRRPTRTARGTRPALRAVDSPPAIEARGVTRRFGVRTALDGVSVSVARGEVHALLGPNGAGKTTFLRALTGLVAPDSGEVRVVGLDATRATRAARARTGFVPAGDRTFYLRLSGLENLLFFGRLHGIRRRAARKRALEVIEDVGLSDAARRPVGTYSHGMQKRLSVGRALLTRPEVLLVDEATHDLDPSASAGVRAIISGLADQGTAVLWATQRIDEIRGFAHTVTLLGDGSVRFSGSVPGLMAHAEASAFVVRLEFGADPGAQHALASVLGGVATVEPYDGEHWLLELAEGRLLSDAVSALAASGVHVLSCHRERSELEDAFAALSRGAGR